MFPKISINTGASPDNNYTRAFTNYNSVNRRWRRILLSSSHPWQNAELTAHSMSPKFGYPSLLPFAKSIKKLKLLNILSYARNESLSQQEFQVIVQRVIRIVKKCGPNNLREFEFVEVGPKRSRVLQLFCKDYPAVQEIFRVVGDYCVHLELIKITGDLRRYTTEFIKSLMKNTSKVRHFTYETNFQFDEGILRYISRSWESLERLVIRDMYDVEPGRVPLLLEPLRTNLKWLKTGQDSNEVLGHYGGFRKLEYLGLRIRIHVGDPFYNPQHLAEILDGLVSLKTLSCRVDVYTDGKPTQRRDLVMRFLNHMKEIKRICHSRKVELVWDWNPREHTWLSEFV